MINIIDTHCHYNLSPLWENWSDHWQTAQSHGVMAGLVVGTDLESSQRAIHISHHQPRLKCAIGLHPSEFSDPDQQWVESSITSLVEKITTLFEPEVVVAIGEVGLDYFRLPENSVHRQLIIAAQKLAFQQFLELAYRLQLPIILHVRDQYLSESPTADNAYWDVWRLVTQFRAQHANWSVPIILHCLSGPASYLAKMLELGAYVGVAANVTYPKANQLRQLISLVPAHRLLLETDAPFLPPQSYRGQICQPWRIAETAEFMEQSQLANSLTLMANTLKIWPDFKAN